MTKSIMHRDGYIAAGLLAFILAFAAPPAAAESDAQILHVINRLSFGPAPGDVEVVRRMGIEGYIQQQLHPKYLSMPQDLQSRLEDLPTLNASIAALGEKYGAAGNREGKLTPEERKEVEQKQKIIAQELSQAKILRAVASPAQLQEVMVDFWFNHFNVFVGKGADRVFTSSYERDAIRPYALGKFQKLLEATAHHPAMLFYLDNWENTDPNSILASRTQNKQGKRGKQLGINENYAREIMELHTLGVNGGYTQIDVTTLAHILTGWGLSRGRGFAEKASFYFDANRHDANNKIFLGERMRGGGADEIERVLYVLAHHPSTAKHIAYELAQYFVVDKPPESLVSALAHSFEASDGDITAVLNTLFHAPEFWDPQYYQAKFKPPFRFVVSVLRVNDMLPPGNMRLLEGALAQMGEPLYRCQTPNGYGNTNDDWLNSDAVLKRVSFAKSIAPYAGKNSGAAIKAALGSNWSANTLATVQAEAADLQPALLLGSPEFLYY